MKLSKKQFIAILTKNAGLFNRTAKAITKSYGIEISRQSVRERAMKYPGILKEIEEINVDNAEEGLHDLMHSKIPAVQLKAIDLYLRTKAKHRGYSNSMDMNLDFNSMTNDQLDYMINELLKRIK